MTERGILMTPANYGKIEAGTKWMTRRILTPQPEGDPRPLLEWSRGIATACHDHSPDQNKLADHAARLQGKIFPFTSTAGGLVSPRCPYGKPGDRCYVKESHYLWGRWDLDGFTTTGRQKYRFRRTTTEIRYRENPPTKALAVGKSITSSKWHKRSALFMEKKDARLWLEIVEVRVERLNDISEEDAKAEGARIPPLVYPDQPHEAYSYVENFRLIWESNKIHKPGSWERNPFVWVLAFKKVQP
jgi:hypothetical protein